MPLQRRIPKSGFRSRKSLTREEVYLSDLNKIEADIIDFAVLIESWRYQIQYQRCKNYCIRRN